MVFTLRKDSSQLLICLTGGVASGKTVVSNCFAENGVDVIDTDILSRRVVEVGSDGLSELVTAFGSQILDSNNALNRSYLRRLVFQDKESLLKLNSILHPRIRHELLKQLDTSTSKIIVVVVPLYSGQQEYGFFDRVCVVDVSEDVQLSRLMERDSIEVRLAKDMVNSQISRKARLELGNDVITNNGSLSQLKLNAFVMLGAYTLMHDYNNQACQ
ncbi:dephospho-CoA kinase [Marinicella rhabdoformis]|uniref:dephospho-CoA kinase n=1 Tax=Marinicella rhabdoformis TaxID=2580566 RepID=UPI0012AEBE2A|nr:dephospho-CoA kinase [Marinicella rhabdoformis]